MILGFFASYEKNMLKSIRISQNVRLRSENMQVFK